MNNQKQKNKAYKITLLNDVKLIDPQTTIVDKVFASSSQLAYAAAYSIANDLNKHTPETSNWRVIEVVNIVYS